MDTTTKSCRKLSQCLLVRGEIIHNHVDSALWPCRQHILQPESKARFCRFCGKSFSCGYACVGVKSTKPLNSPVAFVTVWTEFSMSSPCLSSSGYCLERTHFVKADNLPPSGTMSVDLNYSVFFTSNSGSLLSHHVWPVRNRRPCRERMCRIVSRLIEEIPEC